MKKYYITAWVDSVFIAFRLLVRFQPVGQRKGKKCLKNCLHCLSAFSPFPTRRSGLDNPRADRGCLHCLSAFSPFPTTFSHGQRLTYKKERSLHCLSAFSPFPTRRLTVDRSQLLCLSLHCLSAFSPFPTDYEK